MIQAHREMLIRLDREQRAIERKYQSQGRTYARLIRLHAIAAARIGGEVEQAIHDIIYGNREIDQDGMGHWIYLMLVVAYLFGQRRAILENEKLRPANPAMRDDFENDADWLTAWLGVHGLNDDLQSIQLNHSANEMLSDFYGGIASALQRYRANDDLVAVPREQLIRLALKSRGITVDHHDAWAMPQLLSLIVGLGLRQGFARGLDTQDDLVGYRYSTMRDNRVRPTHRQLEGMTRPKDDPIWAKLTPPIGFRCRCWRLPVFANQPFAETAIPNVEPDPGWDRTLRFLQI